MSEQNGSGSAYSAALTRFFAAIDQLEGAVAARIENDLASADIEEELDRLDAHVEAANDLLASDEAVGRKFDFLAQEFNREANTLCSKAADRALSAIGLELKTVIDQLREQVQNIE